MGRNRKDGFMAVLVLGLMCAVLPGCGGGGGGAGGGGGVSPNLMGGSVQGTPLSLNNNSQVATLASLGFNGPIGITTNGTNLYVADYNNNKIRKVTPGGGVSTLAGSGVQISADGFGANASFDGPFGITTDGPNLYVAEIFAIRKVVINTGEVTTIAGTGSSGFHDDPTNGLNATFDTPQGITWDGKDLYVADSVNNAIRKIELASGNYGVTTIAGIGPGSPGSQDDPNGLNATFDNPQGITTDGTTLYVADYNNNAIRTVKINSPHLVETLAGAVGGGSGSDDGIGRNATFFGPVGVTSDGTNLFVADSLNYMIRKVEISTKNVTTLAGTGSFGSNNGVASAATFDTPEGITTNGTKLYVSDTANNMIRVIQ